MRYHLGGCLLFWGSRNLVACAVCVNQIIPSASVMQIALRIRENGTSWRYERAETGSLKVLGPTH